MIQEITQQSWKWWTHLPVKQDHCSSTCMIITDRSLIVGLYCWWQEMHITYVHVYQFMTRDSYRVQGSWKERRLQWSACPWCKDCSMPACGTHTQAQRSRNSSDWCHRTAWDPQWCSTTAETRTPATAQCTEGPPRSSHARNLSPSTSFSCNRCSISCVISS